MSGSIGALPPNTRHKLRRSTPHQICPRIFRQGRSLPHSSGATVTRARYLRRSLKYLSSDELAQSAEASVIMSQITAASSNTAQIEYWNSSSGETWAQFQEPLDRQIEPLGLAAIDVLKPREGQHIVDIGCGCGQTTLSLASRVGVTGSVMGVDISKPMPHA
jgi:predicted TPR repeat methyltransferase